MRTDLDLKSVKSRADLKSCPYLETTARESSTRHAIFQGFWKLRPRRRKSIEGADVAIRLPINPQQQATMRRRRGQARDDREREREREREEVDWRAREGGTRGTMEKREEGMVVGWRSKGWGVRHARVRAEKEREREREKEREWSVKLGHSAIDAFGRNRTNSPLSLFLSVSPTSTSSSSFSSSSCSFVVPFSLFRDSTRGTHRRLYSAPEPTVFGTTPPAPFVSFAAAASAHRRLRPRRRALPSSDMYIRSRVTMVQQ